MKTLMLMRHAKSSWAESGVDDFDRELNARGKKAAPLMGEWFVSHSLVPDVVLASTAKRAKETARLVTDAADFRGEILWEQRLYLAPAELLLEIVSTIDDRFERLLVIAHNPGLEHLVSTLRHEFVPFPTAAVACFESTAHHWRDATDLAQWRPIQFATPKEL